ncbi:hypothetical protein [Orenia marismortui]|uniref:Uncharacterized protein n=1 Tax=Orenia marismortui TaxID=46469 RepID=A0A4R8H4D1_9FIRM|nr:hypothetical protein [Orenia marismortui]TDX51661.1 hypothetical protein C7959_11157 [Orenia marismortui]
MKLIDFFRESSTETLNTIANKHNIFYNPNFSKSWLSKQIKYKLTQEKYLSKIITHEISPQAHKLINKLVHTESINKDSLAQEVFEELNNLGIIYSKNNFCYIPKDLRTIIRKSLENTNSTHNDNKKIFKKKLNNTTPTLINESLQINNTSKITFFAYVVLVISYANKVISNNNLSSKELKRLLLSYIKKINFTSCSEIELLNYILDYSYNKELIFYKNKQFKNNFKLWLESSYQEKLLNSLKLFFPHDFEVFRRIISVLIYYPLNKNIPLEFIIKEFQLNLTEEKGKILKLLNIFNIEDSFLSLTDLCWNLFNSDSKEFSNKINIIKDEIIIDSNIELTKLWLISQKASLIEINNYLKFKLDKGGRSMSKNLEKKYPSLRELRLKRIKGEYQGVSDEQWKELLNEFKLENNITGNESLRIDLAYRTLHYPL